MVASLVRRILSRETEIEVEHEFEAMTFVVRLGATLFFVLLNGFFVSAEFAFVKVRGSRIEALANTGNGRAKVAEKILGRLDLYLSSCQFGITVSSLILGWLAEPAIAELLIVGAHAVGLPVGESALFHGISLAVALTIVTTLHMTLGEQAPKIWAIQRAEAAALGVYLHGATAARLASVNGDTGLLASDLLPELPLTINDLKTGESEEE